MVIAYLCLYEGMDLAQAISMVKTARRQAQPSEGNENFMTVFIAHC